MKFFDLFLTSVFVALLAVVGSFVRDALEKAGFQGDLEDMVKKISDLSKEIFLRTAPDDGMEQFYHFLKP